MKTIYILAVTRAQRRGQIASFNDIFLKKNVMFQKKVHVVGERKGGSRDSGWLKAEGGRAAVVVVVILSWLLVRVLRESVRIFLTLKGLRR